MITLSLIPPCPISSPCREIEGEALNKRVDAALFERDEEARKQMYHDLQNDIMHGAPMTYIMQTMSSTAKRDMLKKWNCTEFRNYYDHESK